MAEFLIFHYQKSYSFLHKTDVLIKLAGMFCLSFLLVPVSLFRLAIILPVILIAHFVSLISIKSYLREGVFFIIIGAVILIANTLSSGSLLLGILKFIRFYLILWMALIFTFTTDPMHVSSGIYRILKPLPLLPARRFSTILGLSLTILPLILDQIREIREAMVSRGGKGGRSIFRNIVGLGLPLIDGILIKAEDLSNAMESRLFTEDATPPEKQSGYQGYKIIFILLFSIVVILLGEYFIPGEGPSSFFVRHY